MQSKIKYTFFFPYPIEIVCDYFTKAELLSQWLIENDIQPIIGQEFLFRSKPAPMTEPAVSKHLKILTVQDLFLFRPLTERYCTLKQDG